MITRNNRLFRAILPAVFLLFALVALPTPSHADAPADAIHTAQKGIDEANAALFMESVDFNSIMTSASDALMEVIRQQVNEGALGDSSLALAFSLAEAADKSGQAGLVKNLLASEVRNLVTVGINGGYFAGNPNGTVTPSSSSLAWFLTKMPTGRRQLVPGSVISRSGNKSVINATYVDPQAGSFALKLGMEEQGGRWRVTEIANAKELFNEAVQHNQ